MKYLATATVFLGLVVALYGFKEVEAVAARKQTVAGFGQARGGKSL